MVRPGSRLTEKLVTSRSAFWVPVKLGRKSPVGSDTVEAIAGEAAANVRSAVARRMVFMALSLLWRPQRHECSAARARFNDGCFRVKPSRNVRFTALG